MTHSKLHKLIDKLRRNTLTDTEANDVAYVLNGLIDLCDETQNEEGCVDIFGTEGWEHRVGVE